MHSLTLSYKIPGSRIYNSVKGDTVFSSELNRHPNTRVDEHKFLSYIYNTVKVYEKYSFAQIIGSYAFPRMNITTHDDKNDIYIYGIPECSAYYTVYCHLFGACWGMSHAWCGVSKWYNIWRRIYFFGILFGNRVQNHSVSKNQTNKHKVARLFCSNTKRISQSCLWIARYTGDLFGGNVVTNKAWTDRK